MDKLLRLRMIVNKKNKSATIQLPKKEFDKEMRKKITGSKWAWCKFEGFE